jgi:hypothetical protein
MNPAPARTKVIPERLSSSAGHVPQIVRSGFPIRTFSEFLIWSLFLFRSRDFVRSGRALSVMPPACWHKDRHAGFIEARGSLELGGPAFEGRRLSFSSQGSVEPGPLLLIAPFQRSRKKRCSLLEIEQRGLSANGARAQPSETAGGLRIHSTRACGRSLEFRLSTGQKGRRRKSPQVGFTPPPFHDLTVDFRA